MGTGRTVAPECGVGASAVPQPSLSRPSPVPCAHRPNGSFCHGVCTDTYVYCSLVGVSGNRAAMSPRPGPSTGVHEPVKHGGHSAHAAHAFSSRDRHDMQLLPLRARSVPSPSGAFTTCVAAGARGVLRSIARCSRRLTILLPFVALALRPEDASAQMPIYVRNLTPGGGQTHTLMVQPSDDIRLVKFFSPTNSLLRRRNSTCSTGGSCCKRADP